MPDRAPSTIDFTNTDPVVRYRLAVEGLVQGMGFRPFVQQLAIDLELAGWVRNVEYGLQIEVQGTTQSVELFMDCIRTHPPPLACVDAIAVTLIGLKPETAFQIRQSTCQNNPIPRILPDLATCPRCIQELTDPDNHRYRYPFISCTQCGPRYSIVTRLPYDRENTTMEAFTQCQPCQSEYQDAADRRFHSQTNSCPHCGPHLILLDSAGLQISRADNALQGAADAIKSGAIVAIKGVGGFQLVADATNNKSIQRLRTAKQRPLKPFALMMSSLQQIQDYTEPSVLEQQLLASPQAPIVLLQARPITGNKQATLSPLVAPGNPLLGVMLPSTALHYLLLEGSHAPQVVTSANISAEPIIMNNASAGELLESMADYVLLHEREIATALDDTVVRVIDRQATVLRLGRGYAPVSLRTDSEHPPFMALGGHLKTALSISHTTGILVGPHIGDLDTPAARLRYEQSIRHWQTLYSLSPSTLIIDAHAGYYSSQWAERTAMETHAVQHHAAHVFSCAAEHDIRLPFTGIAWDGNGMGDDGTVWGGECFSVGENGIQRVAHLRHFPLPGGEAAIREPRRSALGLLYALYGRDYIMQADDSLLNSFSADERGVLAQMMTRGFNSPLTSSIGRLFDAIAALLGIVQVNAYEGHAASMLEYAAVQCGQQSIYHLDIVCVDNPLPIIDWHPMLSNLLADRDAGVPVAAIAYRFHCALADCAVDLAQLGNVSTVVLSGGCFQNRLLTEKTMSQLRVAGFNPHAHSRVPPNDGGLAAGQLFYAARTLDCESVT